MSMPHGEACGKVYHISKFQRVKLYEPQALYFMAGLLLDIYIFFLFVVCISQVQRKIS